MKLSLATFAITATLALVHAAEPVAVALTKNDLPPSPQAAMEAVTKTASLPAGVSLTGSTEIIPTPSSASASASSSTSKTKEDKKDKDDASTTTTSTTTVVAHEQFLGGWGGLGWGGWGGWGGFGGFGPYRFGYSCGGLGGWAYPLGYWNAFGSALFGGGCGLGLAYGGLFYC